MIRVLGQVLQRETVLIAASEMLLGAIGIYVAFWSSAPDVYAHTSPSDCLFIVILLILCFVTISGILGLYRISSITNLYSFVLKLVVAVCFAFSASVIIRWMMTSDVGIVSKELGIAAITVPLTWLGCLIATQVIFRVAVSHRLFARRVFIIASPEEAARFEGFIAGGRGRRFEEMQLIRADRNASNKTHGLPPIPDVLLQERVWAVVVTTAALRVLPASVLLDLRLRGVQVLSEAAFWEHEGCWIDIDGLDVSWVFANDGFRSGRVSTAVKRALDLVVAAALLAATSPVMLLFAILIKLESPGPVLYRQERVGLHGRPFILYKFRSMRQDAEAAGVPQWAAVCDPRVTRIGRFIRYTRIDELPQLVNVLHGEMSLVGPRPERPYFVNQLAARIPFYAQRHCVKPGITGWAQINAPYGASLDDARYKLRYDLYYAKNRSFFLDLWILICTVHTVLFRQGAR